MTQMPQIDIDKSLREAMQSAGVAVDDVDVTDDVSEDSSSSKAGEAKDFSSPARKEKKEKKPVEVDDDDTPDIDDEAPDIDDEAPDIDEAELQSAIKALKRDNVPEAQIQRMLKEDPEHLLDWGQQRSKQQTTIDDKFKKHEATSQELAELRRQLKNAGLKTDDGTPPAPADQRVPADITEKLATMREGIEGYFGEPDLADAIEQPFQSLASSIVSFVEERMQRQDKSLHEFIDAANRTKAADDYPQLEDDDAYRRVLDRMAQVEHLREYGSRMDLLKDAAQIEFAKEIAESALSERTSTRKRRDSGTPKKATGAQTSVASMTLPELQDAELRARLSGDTARADKVRQRIQKLIS